LSGVSVPPLSCSIRWSASVAWRFLHQWHRGLSARSSRRALRYAVLDVRLGIVVWLTRFACPSALALLGCCQVYLASEAYGFTVDDLITEVCREVVCVASSAVAYPCSGFVTEGLRHVVCQGYLGRVPPGTIPTVVEARFTLATQWICLHGLSCPSNGRTRDDESSRICTCIRSRGLNAPM